MSMTETYAAPDTGEDEVFGVPEISRPRYTRGGFFLPVIGWLPRFSPAKAMIALISAAAAIDHRRVDQETTEINALIQRTRTLRKLSPKKVEMMRAQIEPRLSPEKIRSLVEHASRTFRRRGEHNKAAASSAFMHACDIVFADGVLAPSEKEFIKDLVFYLNVPAAEAKTFISVLGLKNRF